MKTTLIGLLVLTLFGGGILCLQKASQAKRERARAAEAQQKLRETEAYAAQQEEQSKLLREKLQQTHLQSLSKESEATELKQQLITAANSSKASEPSPGAKLFKDPQMKSTMKKQQMENVERTANKIVNADFIKQLGLSGEQAAYLKELLKKKYGPGADITIELMAGELSDAEMAEMGKQFKQQMAEADGQIKTFLGEDAYKTFEWQEKSQEERSRIKDFQKKLDNIGQPLSAEQQDGLARAMYDERQGFKFRVDYSDPANYDYEHLHEFFGDDNFNLFFNDMEQLNEKIFQRAQAILTPEQSAQFKTMQQDQLEKGKVVVRMTNALFGKRAAH